MSGAKELLSSCDERAGAAPGKVVLGPGWNGCGGAVLQGLQQTFAAYALDEVRPVLDKACRAAEDGLHVTGFVAYEAAPAFDRAMRCKPPRTPLVWMAAFTDRRAWAPDGVPSDFSSLPVPLPARFAYDPAHYLSLVRTVQEHIREGDVYQVNITGPMSFAPPCEPWLLFQALLRRQPVPYAAWLDAGPVQVLSCSPELFFDRRGDAVITRPMKGTVPRGRNASEDTAFEQWLEKDEKNRAENVMIVDLLRNDLSKCCEPGSVHTTDLFSTERYETLIQMTTSVRGRLSPGAATQDIFAALFPCGSVTGAPKVRAMDIIRRCESEPRGAYCGAVGYMHRDRAVFNVAIRTAEVLSGEARLGVGSGLVWDSVPEEEYEECLLKAGFLTGSSAAPPGYGSSVASSPSDLLRERGPTGDRLPPLLIETMRCGDGAIALLERHTDRLRTSARILGYDFDEQAFRRCVADAACVQGTGRIRATVDAAGRIEVSVHPLDGAHAPGIWRLCLAGVRIDSSDPYRRHKTTYRERYDRLHREAVREGFDEVIFLNERGEVAEGSRTNIVAEFGSRRITPPVDSGALPGVYRRFLLETRSDLEEGVLFPEDLRRADALYVCNAVAGYVPARLHGADVRIHEESPA